MLHSLVSTVVAPAPMTLPQKHSVAYSVPKYVVPAQYVAQVSNVMVSLLNNGEGKVRADTLSVTQP